VDASGACCLWDEASGQHLGSALVPELQGGPAGRLDPRAALLVGRAASAWQPLAWQLAPPLPRKPPASPGRQPSAGWWCHAPPWRPGASVHAPRRCCRAAPDAPPPLFPLQLDGATVCCVLWACGEPSLVLLRWRSLEVGSVLATAYLGAALQPPAGGPGARPWCGRRLRRSPPGSPRPALQAC
jgi:hypothetical protein